MPEGRETIPRLHPDGCLCSCACCNTFHKYDDTVLKLVTEPFAAMFKLCLHYKQIKRLQEATYFCQ